PLDLRLYLPDQWRADPAPPDKAGGAQAGGRAPTQAQNPLGVVGRGRGQGGAGWGGAAGGGDGGPAGIRAGGGARGGGAIVGVTEDFVVFAQPPAWVPPAPTTGGRPQTRPQLAEGSPRPVPLHELAARLPRRKVTWRQGTKGKLSGRFAWFQVWPGHGWQRG